MAIELKEVVAVALAILAKYLLYIPVLLFIYLGTLKKNRFEPSHALALALRPDQVKHVCNLESDCPQIKAYLNGQTLNMDGEKGWYLVTVDGYSIGWGKLAGGILKNHYPKGLRKNG